MSRALLALAAALCLLLPAAVAQAAVPEAPAGTPLDALYAPPPAATEGERGSGVWWQEVGAGDPVRSSVAARTLRLIFRSRSLEGAPQVESATVYVPSSEPPQGGWPVVAWGHVTTGGADLCAPSRATPLLPGTQARNPEYGRLTRAVNVIDRLVRGGHVVVRPDYAGLGTPGPHPYLIGDSLGSSMIDSVRATRELLGSVSTRWVAAGQSEGGIAAAFSSARADELAPELELTGTAIVTPPIDNRRLVFGAGLVLDVGTVNALAALMLSGAQVADPGLAAARATQILTPLAERRWAGIERVCLGQLEGPGQIGALAPWQMLRLSSGPWLQRLGRVLDASDPRWVQLGDEPVRFIAGGLDPVALQPMIADAARRQRAAGADVSFRAYPLATHQTITDDAQAGRDLAAWIAARLAR